MDYHKRNRRRKGRCAYSIPSNVSTSNRSTSGGICSYLIMSSLIAVIYLLLEYNCNTCGAKSDLNNITKHVENIANNLNGMKESYRDLERQVERFALELPKFEGQLGILEAVANTLESRDLGWDPYKHLPLPNVAVNLARSKGNTTKNPNNICKKTARIANEVDLDQNPH